MLDLRRRQPAFADPAKRSQENRGPVGCGVAACEATSFGPRPGIVAGVDSCPAPHCSGTSRVARFATTSPPAAKPRAALPFSFTFRSFSLAWNFFRAVLRWIVKSPRPGFPADVRETQKVERLGRAFAALRTPFFRVAPELDQRVFSGCSSKPNLVIRSFKAARQRGRRIPRGSRSRNRRRSVRRSLLPSRGACRHTLIHRSST